MRFRDIPKLGCTVLHRRIIRGKISEGVDRCLDAVANENEGSNVATIKSARELERRKRWRRARRVDDGVRVQRSDYWRKSATPACRIRVEKDGNEPNNERT